MKKINSMAVVGILAFVGAGSAYAGSGDEPAKRATVQGREIVWSQPAPASPDFALVGNAKDNAKDNAKGYAKSNGVEQADASKADAPKLRGRAGYVR